MTLCGSDTNNTTFARVVARATHHSRHTRAGGGLYTCPHVVRGLLTVERLEHWAGNEAALRIQRAGEGVGEAVTEAGAEIGLADPVVVALHDGEMAASDLRSGQPAAVGRVEAKQVGQRCAGGGGEAG